MQTEVLIVGAGPTGLALACQMIRYGIDFQIIDRNETTTPHSKAIGVHDKNIRSIPRLRARRNLSVQASTGDGVSTLSRTTRVLRYQRHELSFQLDILHCIYHSFAPYLLKISYVFERVFGIIKIRPVVIRSPFVLLHEAFFHA